MKERQNYIMIEETEQGKHDIVVKTHHKYAEDSVLLQIRGISTADAAMTVFQYSKRFRVSPDCYYADVASLSALNHKDFFRNRLKERA